MNAKTGPFALIVLLAALLATACGGSQSGGDDKTIKSASAGSLNVTLANKNGEVKSGDNDMTVTFADSSGTPVDVGAVAFKFHMPAMGSMAEMNDAATLTTTDTAGKYRAHIHVEMPGSWEAVINYQGPKGTGQATMTVAVQ